MKRNVSGSLAPVAGYLTEQLVRMRDLAAPEDMPSFDIIEYGKAHGL